MRIDCFIPYGSQAITTGAASVTTALTRGTVVRVFNAGAFPVFLRFGDASAVAVAGDCGLATNGVESFSVAPDTYQQAGNMGGQGPTYIAVISPGGAGSVNVTTGEGGN